MFEQFHFIQPLWLLALIPLLLLAWHMHRFTRSDNPWSRIIDGRLLPLLMVGQSDNLNRTVPWLATIGWLIAVLALGAEGHTGLVVYAADGFTVSPLRRDVNTIRALLKVLEPSIMPAPGSRADLGLLKADELLREAGASNSQVLLITDGVAVANAAASEQAAARLGSHGYNISVVGVGIEDGAPQVYAHGEAARHASGTSAVPGLDFATYSLWRVLAVANTVRFPTMAKHWRACCVISCLCTQR
jgi:Ca-activated chloride channel homolog